MKKLSRTALASTTAAVAILAVRDADAAGIGLDVQSGRGTGMASAVTASIDDASGIFYNPAGIAQGKGLEAQVGDTVIIPSFSFTPPGGTSTSNSFELIPPFHAYLTGGITDDLSIGVGVFTPYGSTIKWPDGWAGRNVITSSNLATYDINPTVAYRFGPVRFGAGLQVVRATVDLKKQVRTGAEEASTELGGSAWGVGANVGAQVEIVKQYLSLGVHYRSAVKVDFDDGKAHFDNVPPELQGTLHDQTATTTLTNPDTLAIAVATRPVPQLVLDGEVVWTGWSKVRSIDITFPNDTSGSLNSSQPKNWSNTLNYRVGGELALNDAWRVRAGVLYDPSPSPANTLTPDIPDADRINIALGGGYADRSGWYVDLGYQFLVLFKRTSTAAQLPGDYSGIVNLVSLSVGYRTAKRPAAAPEPAVQTPPEALPTQAPVSPPPPAPAAPPPSVPPAPPAAEPPPAAPAPAPLPAPPPPSPTTPASPVPPPPPPGGMWLSPAPPPR